MKEDYDELLESLTEQHKKVIRAFKALRECPEAIAERTGLSMAEVEATLQELVEMGLVSCSR